MNEWMNEWKRIKGKERQIKFKEIVFLIYIYMCMASFKDWNYFCEKIVVSHWA